MAFATVNFYSLALRRTVDVNVVLPTDKRLDGTEVLNYQQPCKTLYLLHGLFGDHNDWVHGTRLQALANDYGLCVVMPSGDNSCYVDAPGYGRKYSTFISEELVRFTRNTFRLSEKREDTFIGGLSMGGFGSLVNGLKHPETFGAICALSSALIKDAIVNATGDPPTELHAFTAGEYAATFGLANVKDYAGSEWDYDAIAEKMAGEALKPRIYMSCGTEDSLFPANVAFKDRLIRLGYDVTWEADPGNHEWSFWDSHIERSLNWLPLGPAVKGVSSENVL